MTQTLGSACFQLDDEQGHPPQLRLIPGGRKQAFERALVAARSALRARALRLTRNAVAAEDLVQDTMLRALRFEETFQHGTNLQAWLNQVLFSVFATNCRRRARDRRAMEWLANDPCAWSRPEAAPTMTALSPALQDALESLPEQYQAVLRLVDLEELSYRDAAHALGVPVGTVMSRLFRARKSLAAIVEAANAA